MLITLAFLFCLPVLALQFSRWNLIANRSNPKWGRVTLLLLACALIPLASAYNLLSHSSAQTFFIGVFICIAIGLAIIDGATGYLPDVLTIPLLIAGLILNFLGGYLEWDMLNRFDKSVVGCALGYVAIFVANKAHLRFTGIDGIGMGDAKLLAAIGAWFGPINLITVIGIASGLSLMIPLITWACKQERRAGSAPFGPYIAVGAVITLLK